MEGNTEVRKSFWQAIDESPFNPSNAFKSIFGPPPRELRPLKSPVPPPSRVSRPLVTEPLSSASVARKSHVSVNLPTTPPDVADPVPTFIFSPDSPRKTIVARNFRLHPIDVPGVDPTVSPVAWVTEAALVKFEFDLDDNLIVVS
jgi:hypothetical protein